MKVIAVCSCSGVKEKAIQAFKIMYPKEEVPPIYVGKDAVLKFAESKAGTNIGEYMKATAKRNSRYSYYVEYNESGDVTAIYNLSDGKKVA